MVCICIFIYNIFVDDEGDIKLYYNHPHEY